jgi:hypothetical protein
MYRVFQTTSPSSSNSTTTTAQEIVNPNISGKREDLFPFEGPDAVGTRLELL